MTQVKVSQDAATEFEQAVIWYEHEQPGPGARLIEAFATAIKLLDEPNPQLSPVTGQAAALGTKKLILHKFPYSLITLTHHQTLIVVALAHHARKPGYWLARVRP